MNAFTLAICYIRHRALPNSLLVLLLALGMAVMSLLLHLSHEAQARFSRDAQGIDLVVGAKGSPLQLILSSIYHLDIPTGNIDREQAERLMRHPQVKFAIPLALGDSYQRFRIVGTDRGYIKHYNASLAQGVMFDTPMQVVIGAQVQRETGLSVGGHFAGHHGLVESGDVHEDSPYTVVGVLAPTGTVMDRLIITPLASVWQVHGDHAHHDEAGDTHAHKHHHKPESLAQQAGKEITALLIGYKNKIAAMSLPREVNRATAMQAASPALEITRLFGLIGIGLDALMWFGGVLMVSALIGMLTALYQSLHQRRYDMAVMVALGASTRRLAAQLLIETGLLLAAGILLGLLIGHLILFILPSLTPQLSEFHFAAFTLYPFELLVAAGLLACGLLLALLTIARIRRMDASRLLVQG